jgi:hypothetical protein
MLVESILDQALKSHSTIDHNQTSADAFDYGGRTSR